MGCVMVAARAVAVVVGTWLVLVMLMVPLAVLTALPRNSLLGDILSSAVVPLWGLALIVGPLVACFVLRRWIGVDRASGPDWPPPPRSDDQGYFQAPRDPHDPPAPEAPRTSQAPHSAQAPSAPEGQEQRDAEARRRARADAERAREEEVRRRARRNRHQR